MILYFELKLENYTRSAKIKKPAIAGFFIN